MDKSKVYHCVHCGKVCPWAHNYCDFNCMIEEAKKNGGTVHCPNGLPIACVKWNGNMYEHEHGDHPDYKFPVITDYVGEKSAAERFTWSTGAGVTTPMDGAYLEHAMHERHALIYTDGVIALTMYETCYAMWGVTSGKCMGGSLWDKKEWKLSQESLDKLQKFCQDNKLVSE